MFEQGTSATMVLPDGSTQPLSSVNVRATEYTVGQNGPAAMPGELPHTSGYTYAAEFSVDEAMQAGAVEVRFDKPVVNYVENFVGFPVGTAVPTGYYDRVKGQWIASENGRVIQVTGSANGLAEIDIDGNGLADSADSLLAMGIDDIERKKLATLYETGESLWRTEITHFTPWDHNWPFGPPADAIAPLLGQNNPYLSRNDESCRKNGSIISVENQTLGEVIDITGAPCGLYYNSASTLGFDPEYILPVNLTGSSLPGSLKRIVLRIDVAGKSYSGFFLPDTNLTYTFQWDGKDAYGRTVQGATSAVVNIGYVYDGVYNQPSNNSRSFANTGRQPITGNRQTNEVTLWQNWSTIIGHMVWKDFGGWQPGIHHHYDLRERMLYEGNGNIQPAENRFSIVKVALDQDELNGRAKDLSIRADGSIYVNVAAGGIEKIIRKNPDGTLETVFQISQCGGVASLSTYFEEGPRCATIGWFDVTNDGIIYFTNDSFFDQRIYKVSKNRQVEVFAGTGDYGYNGDGGPAVSAAFNRLTGIAIAEDGAIYVADSGNNVIRKIGTDGIITTVAGTGDYGYSGDGGPALQAEFMDIQGIDVGSDGSLFIADADQNRVRKVRPDGIITTVAGSGEPGSSVESSPDHRGDGGSASQAWLFQPTDVAVDSDGSLYIAENHGHQIRKVTPDGVIYRYVGLFDDEEGGFNYNNGPAQATRLNSPLAVAIGPDKIVYFSEVRNPDVRLVETDSDYFDGSESIIASGDGSQLYVFDARGKHLRTEDALTRNTIFEFTYDSSGLLSTITDINRLVTSVERDTAGTPTAIVAPFGQRTELIMGLDGYLSSLTNPEGETYRFGYTEDGLLTQVTDPKGNVNSYAYDLQGYFVRADYPNGGVKQLSKIETEDGFKVTMTTAEGSMEVYEVEKQVDGTVKYINTDANGLQSVKTNGSDGSVTVTAPDGTTTFTKQKPDPRFGMQAPITDTLKVTMPSGLTSVFSQTRTITQMTGHEVTGLTDSLITNGKITVSEYDGNQNLTTTTSAEGRQTFTKTDSLGRIIQSSIPGLEPINYTYDSTGFLIKTEQGGRTTEFIYNAEGHLEGTTDPLGRTTSTEYDSVGRVTKQILTNGEEIGYTYDENGNLSSIAPPGQPAHTFEYTEVDLTDSYTPPAVPDSAGGINYLYDKDNKLLETVFSDSSSIQMVYDTTFSGSGRPIEIIYDQNSTAFAYDSTTGNLTSVASSDSVMTNYSFDGSLTTQIATNGPGSGTVDFTYNNDFQVTSQSINGANTVGFTYDDDGLLVGAGELSMSYDFQNGQLTADTLGNMTSSYAYNSFGELTSKTAVHNGSDLYNRSFTRDSLGRITGITETIDGQTDTYEYTYNSIGYLAEEKVNGVITAEYAYDANGNRTMVVADDDTVTATYDSQDRMLTYGDANYAYGKRGDLQKKIAGTDTTTYEYDNIGNLRSVILPDGKVIEYVIDGKNRRVAKKVNDQVTKRWLYSDGLLPVAELDSAGNIQKRYAPGYIVKNDTTYRVIKDHLGSVRMVVNSQTGEVVQHIDYDAWGNITYLQNQLEFTDIGFAGGLYDRDTGLIRFGARDYDPQTGRWTSKDPILFEGGTSNLYEYVLNDPVNNVDPGGLQPIQAPQDSTSTYDRLSDSFYGLSLGAGTSDAMIAEYQKYLWQRWESFYRSSLARSLPSS